MAAHRTTFGSVTLIDGQKLNIFYTYDDVSLVVANFDWDNPNGPTTLAVTVNGTTFPFAMAPGPGTWTPGGAGITLLPPAKAGTSPRFPFTVSIAAG